MTDPDTIYLYPKDPVPTDPDPTDSDPTNGRYMNKIADISIFIIPYNKLYSHLPVCILLLNISFKLLYVPIYTRCYMK